MNSQIIFVILVADTDNWKTACSLQRPESGVRNGSFAGEFCELRRVWFWSVDFNSWQTAMSSLIENGFD